jgi:glycosyltransferase involved in cell wall biosynthesis
MRILHVIDTMNGGGAERLLANILRPLTELGVTNDLATLWPGNVYESEVAPFAERCELGVASRGRARALSTLVRMARRADVVSTHLNWADIYGRTAALLARRPSFSTLHNTWYAPENVARQPRSQQYKIAVVRQLEALTARSAKGLFAVSEAVRETYATALGIPADGIVVLPNFVDVTQFDPERIGNRAEIRKELGVKESDFVIVTVARLAPQKDHASAIRAVAMLASGKPVRLFVAGVGPDEEKLNVLAKELGAPVSFLGLRSDIPQLLFASDLFLFPTFFEGMSVALLEAMCMGIPCLCSDIAENREVAEDCAVYVPPGRAEQLADAVRDLMDDDHWRAELGRKGRERALRLYDSKAAARRLVETISRKVGSA